MSFSVPTFNISCNIWRAASSVLGPPDLVSPCNLQFGRRFGIAGIEYLPSADNISMWLLLPVGTDLRSSLCASFADVVEVPAGTGRMYSVYGVDDVGKGFSNEFRVGLLVGSDATARGDWPQPIP